jgi:uncharacterized membrane protein YeaQ/YmgE (transglycosylase-associated protein family)
MLTHVLIWLIVGFLASHVMGRGRGVVTDIGIGLVGAVVAGLLVGAAFTYEANGFISQVMVAFLGAVVLLAILRLVGAAPSPPVSIGRSRGV